MQKVLNLGHNTLFMLYQFKEEIEKCKNISEQRQKTIIAFIKIQINELQSMTHIFIEGDRMISVSTLIKLCDSIRVELNKWLLEEQQNNSTDHLFQLINENIENNNEYSNKSQHQKYIKLTIKQQGECQSLGFNKNATILFVGQNGGKIKLYGFNNNHKQIKTLKHHQKGVFKLIWMKKSNLLLSSGGNSFILWSKDLKPEVIMDGQTKDIDCIIVNEKEDLIISGSQDKTIKFFRKINKFWICIQIIQTNCFAKSLSLNSQQTKVISCGYGKINIIELNDNKQWIITQQLNTDLNGKLILFIFDNYFVYSPNLAGFLLMFNYQKESKQFVQNQSLLISNHQSRESTSICHFIKETSVLILNYDNQIYFFHLDQNGMFELQKSVDFGKNLRIGSFSDDGYYLATQDKVTNEIQMIKFLSKN